MTCKGCGKRGVETNRLKVSLQIRRPDRSDSFNRWKTRLCPDCTKRASKRAATGMLLEVLESDRTEVDGLRQALKDLLEEATASVPTPWANRFREYWKKGTDVLERSG